MKLFYETATNGNYVNGICEIDKKTFDALNSGKEKEK